MTPPRDFPLTQVRGLGDVALRWLRGERWDEAAPRQASTVMLVRDGERGTEVFMLKRVSQMAFAPSMHVFPGGGVDPRDGDAGLPWAGPSPAEWASRLRCTAAEAQMFVAAAVREVFEEVGVLLAGPSPSSPLVDPHDGSWAGVRDRLVSRDLSLAGVLRERDLVLRSDLIVAKAHWLTPAFEPRRFDTWFFAAVMPEHQVADGETSEAETAEWVVPQELLEAYAAGLASLLPPTVMCVEEIADAPSAVAFVRHSDDLPLIMPVVVDTPEGPAMRIDV
ncbi:NUDIX hydrolase [Intrasporangium calvum]|uniref:NUDIX hydrolase n=1 Tax=Intrasporangium calvum (strain ATCC 23552 / DSM 43043 / JCM 3097 / NBRC 12989 / NCIMB 10167 / NRRL B-3866 / 7 KIP) TaxID=710696 RepID=E6S8Q5_INTC7|nr:NUDIX domain-containing protein [Intrasporangium calvum]ADU47024.1 NUDIX hydrolase [Intrasporangium calvum DSM 43043]AXG12300.1 NUDIX domain-containing protein [Intrasporangium calvum]